MTPSPEKGTWDLLDVEQKEIVRKPHTETAGDEGARFEKAKWFLGFYNVETEEGWKGTRTGWMMGYEFDPFLLFKHLENVYSLIKLNPLSRARGSFRILFIGIIPVP